MSSTSPAQTTRSWLFLADQPALDFLNTVTRVDGPTRDLLQSDTDVRTWLADAGFPAGDETTELSAGALLTEARLLREIIRTLVAQKKAGESVDPQPLNHFLAAASSVKKLVVDEIGGLRVETCYTAQTPARLLGPVAEQAAGLLASSPFELVRQCEHPDCILWFYDRTKSHRRRWCSMALCGNRAKVAKFRQQQK